MKHHRAGMYGRGLRAHFNRLREQKQREKFPGRQRDADGAYTLTGARHPVTCARRKWVAGVSAMRPWAPVNF